MRMRLLASATILLITCSAQSPWNPGRITGVVVDIGEGAIQAFVTVRVETSAKLLAHKLAERSGAFEFESVPSGRYMVTVWANGFRARILPGIVVRDDGTTSLGAVVLEIGSCDAPGAMCDSIGPTRLPRRTKAFELNLHCGVNADSGMVSCPAGPSSHIRLDQDDSRLYLSAMNGAAFTDFNPAEGAPPTRPRVGIDGICKGADLVTRTRKGRRAHLFFVSDVEPGGAVQLYYVLW
jgi:hypothetical protein